MLKRSFYYFELLLNFKTEIGKKNSRKAVLSACGRKLFLFSISKQPEGGNPWFFKRCIFD